jgi:hypothetical protein
MKRRGLVLAPRRRPPMPMPMPVPVPVPVRPRFMLSASARRAGPDRLDPERCRAPRERVRDLASASTLEPRSSQQYHSYETPSFEGNVLVHWARPDGVLGASGDGGARSVRRIESRVPLDRRGREAGGEFAPQHHAPRGAALTGPTGGAGPRAPGHLS